MPLTFFNRSLPSIVTLPPVTAMIVFFCPAAFVADDTLKFAVIFGPPAPPNAS